jgi:hypothetical protein
MTRIGFNLVGEVQNRGGGGEKAMTMLVEARVVARVKVLWWN